MKISIEGNIGSGKSTIISRLCSDMRVPVFLEPVDEWKDWLSMFYSDPARWGMSFNLHVLLTFTKWKKNDFVAVYERSPISNRYIFAQLQYDQGRMNELELKLFGQLYDNLSWTPDLMIYIRTDPKVSLERMNSRGRNCEDGVPLEYLQAVHDKHESIFDGNECLPADKFDVTQCAHKRCKIVIVDGNRNPNDVYADVQKWVHMASVMGSCNNWDVC